MFVHYFNQKFFGIKRCWIYCSDFLNVQNQMSSSNQQSPKVPTFSSVLCSVFHFYFVYVLRNCIFVWKMFFWFLNCNVVYQLLLWSLICFWVKLSFWVWFAIQGHRRIEIMDRNTKLQEPYVNSGTEPQNPELFSEL